MSPPRRLADGMSHRSLHTRQVRHDRRAYGGTMALADRLAAEKNPAREVKCSVCRILAELPPDDAAALREALADPTFTHTAIMRALEAEGHHLKDPQPISRHRRLGHA